jgi:hypothetical protein
VLIALEMRVPAGSETRTLWPETPADPAVPTRFFPARPLEVTIDAHPVALNGPGTSGTAPRSTKVYEPANAGAILAALDVECRECAQHEHPGTDLDYM